MEITICFQKDEHQNIHNISYALLKSIFIWNNNPTCHVSGVNEI